MPSAHPYRCRTDVPPSTHHGRYDVCRHFPQPYAITHHVHHFRSIGAGPYICYVTLVLSKTNTGWEDESDART